MPLHKGAGGERERERGGIQCEGGKGCSKVRQTCFSVMIVAINTDNTNCTGLVWIHG